MLILVLGLVLFLGTHAFTMARGPRAVLVDRLGEMGFKGAYAILSLIGFVLLVYGFGAYRANGYIPVWNPPLWFSHVTLLLTLPIFILLFASYLPGKIKAAVKHPMLLAVKVWATAHLLANGDLGSILLFGGFLAWAVAARVSLKRREPVKVAADVSFGRNDVVVIVAGLIAYIAFVFWLHPLLIGVSVLPGR